MEFSTSGADKALFYRPGYRRPSVSSESSTPSLVRGPHIGDGTGMLSTAAHLQVAIAEALRTSCSSDALLSLCTLRTLLTSSSLRREIVPSALQVSEAGTCGLLSSLSPRTNLALFVWI